MSKVPSTILLTWCAGEAWLIRILLLVGKLLWNEGMRKVWRETKRRGEEKKSRKQV